LWQVRTCRMAAAMTSHAMVVVRPPFESRRRPWRLAEHSGRPASTTFAKLTSAWSINGFERSAARPSL
jgi:hypothetical protein